MDPANNDHHAKETHSGGPDLSKILLPKKEVHSPTNAQRTSAGKLLDQEKRATLKKPKPAPPPPPTPREDTLVKPLQTYQGDVETALRNKDTSVVTMMVAEQERKAQEAAGLADKTPEPSPVGPLLRRMSLYGGGVLLLLLAVGAVVYALIPRATSLQSAPQAPFIIVDDEKGVQVTPGETGSSLMQDLTAALKNETISVGLVAWLAPVTTVVDQSGRSTTQLLSAQDFLSLVAPDAPATLGRAFDPEFLLGVHNFSINQPFIIFHANSYEQAYSSMLDWEPTLKQDLLPLFAYTPSPHTPSQTSTTTATTSPSAEFVPSQFTDRIVQNHDARVLLNQNGDIILLWTFLDRNTLVITTNEYTLGEIITRLKNAPITPSVGQ